MKKSILLSALICVAMMNCKSDDGVSVEYPETKKGDVVDTYFETKINDPYRWLEDDKSAETAAWVEAENKVTYDYLSKIPYRETIHKRIEEMMNYEKLSAPFMEGKHFYFYKNNGLQNQAVVYRKSDGGKPDEVFIDPNTFSKDGTSSLGSLEFSKDGTKVAYEISEGGSDWRKVVVMNADTKQKLEDTLVDIKFSELSWKGNEGFFYSSYDKPKGSELSGKTEQHKLFYHKLGTHQKEDKLIFGSESSRRYVQGTVTEDGTCLVITAANTTYGNELYIKDLTAADSPIVKVVDDFENNYSLLDKVGNKLLITTDFEAPKTKVITIDIKNPARKNWKDVIPQSEYTLKPTTACGFIIANYLKDAVSFVVQYDYNGKKIREIELPGIGTVSGFDSKKEEKVTYYTYTNYSTAVVIYSFNPTTGKSEVYKKPNIKFDNNNYVSEQVFYTSKDETKIPMIITYKKGMKMNGKNPTILYGYGGFNISITPSFSVSNAVWMENGGIFAVANLRGGGEYGQEWHDAGTKLNKQNVFDDFIAAAEYLIKQKYTSSKYLAIKGGSNGGLLVGATLTQRPDLMKVALPAVGVMDMLRYNAFTAGAGWAYDYGTAQDNEEMFQYLLKYSPVHNVKKGVKYPATLITTGDHDDRVVPAHSFKFAAELQEKQAGKNPVLIRIDVKAGHGQGKSTTAAINESADVLSFTFFNMGIKELSKK